MIQPTIAYLFKFRNNPEAHMNTTLLSVDASSPNHKLDLNNHAQEREWFFSGWTRSPAA